MTRHRHIATIDTREQEHVEGKGWRGIRGTGEPLPCHCCGKLHEVHALISVEEKGDLVGMVWQWRKVGTLNYGVSCARKVATVHDGMVARQFDAGRYDRLIITARAAAM